MLRVTTDPTVFRDLVASWCNPDGRNGTASLEKDLAFFKAEGDVKPDLTASRVLDPSFVEAALKELGPYKGASKP